MFAHGFVHPEFIHYAHIKKRFPEKKDILPLFCWLGHNTSRWGVETTVARWWHQCCRCFLWKKPGLTGSPEATAWNVFYNILHIIYNTGVLYLLLLPPSSFSSFFFSYILEVVQCLPWSGTWWGLVLWGGADVRSIRSQNFRGFGHDLEESRKQNVKGVLFATVGAVGSYPKNRERGLAVFRAPCCQTFVQAFSSSFATLFKIAVLLW